MKVEICKAYDKEAAKLIRVNSQAGYIIYFNGVTQSYYVYVYDNV